MSPYYFRTSGRCRTCFQKLAPTPALLSEAREFKRTAFVPEPANEPPPPVPQRIVTGIAFLSVSICFCGFALPVVVDLGWSAREIIGYVSAAALFLELAASLVAGILYARSGSGRRSVKLLLYMNIALAALGGFWFLFLLTNFTT